MLDLPATHDPAETVSITLQNHRMEGFTLFLAVASRTPTQELTGFTKVADSQGTPSLTVFAREMKPTDPESHLLTFSDATMTGVSFIVPGTIVEPGNFARGTGLSVSAPGIVSAIGGQLLTIAGSERACGATADVKNENGATVAASVVPWSGGTAPSTSIAFTNSGRICTLQVLVRTASVPGDETP